MSRGYPSGMVGVQDRMGWQALRPPRVENQTGSPAPCGAFFWTMETLSRGSRLIGQQARGSAGGATGAEAARRRCGARWAVREELRAITLGRDCPSLFGVLRAVLGSAVEGATPVRYGVEGACYLRSGNIAVTGSAARRISSRLPVSGSRGRQVMICSWPCQIKRARQLEMVLT